MLVKSPYIFESFVRARRFEHDIFELIADISMSKNSVGYMIMKATSMVTINLPDPATVSIGWGFVLVNPSAYGVTISYNSESIGTAVPNALVEVKKVKTDTGKDAFMVINYSSRDANGSLDAGNKPIVNVANGTNATDAVNKGQLDGAIVGVNTNLTTLAGRVTVAEGDIVALETLTSTHTGQISTLDGRLVTAEGQIVTLQSDLDTAEIDIGALETLTSDHTTQIGELQAEDLKFLMIDGSRAMTGDLNAGTHKVTGVVAGVADTDAVNKGQLDALDAKVLYHNGAIAMTGDLNMGDHKIIGCATPVQSTDVANKGYVDQVVQGLFIKDPVRASSFGANITLSGAQEIDGVSIVAGDRVLVAGQTDKRQNGIYVCSNDGWSRSEDANNIPNPWAEVKSGMYVLVTEGTNYKDSSFVLSTPDSQVILESSELVFIQFSGAGQINAGDGLSKNGNVISAVGSSTILSDASGLSLKIDSSSAIKVGASGIYAETDGETIEVVGNKLQVKRNANGGLVVIGGALSLDIDTSSFILDSNKLKLASGVAGDGLALAGGVLSINAGNGIELSGDAVAIKLKDTSLQVDASGLSVRLSSESGLEVSDGIRTLREKDKSFVKASFAEGTGVKTITLLASSHGCGPNVDVEILEQVGTALEPVVVDFEINSSGDIVIEVPFDGAQSLDLSFDGVIRVKQRFSVAL